MKFTKASKNSDEYHLSLRYIIIYPLTGGFTGEVTLNGFLGQTPVGGWRGETPINGIKGHVPINGFGHTHTGGGCAKRFCLARANFISRTRTKIL